jgi:chromosome segregation ATPase
MKTDAQPQPDALEDLRPEPDLPADGLGEPAASPPHRVLVGPDSTKDALSLVERLDPSIGEATSVVGATLTELLRRTLRGGVMRIGNQMHGYVSQKVDTVLAERTPAIEQRAAEVADQTARTAATEVATEEVHALAQRTQESERQLAAQIEATAQAAQEQTTETAQSLATQIQETERRAQTALEETARTVQQETAQTAEALTTKMQESEQRTQAAFREQVENLVARAREGRARFKAQIAQLENATTALGQQQEALRQDLARQLEEGQARLRDELRELRKTNAALAARVTELEKPRGLRALFAKLFGRRKPKAPDAVPVD